MAHDRESMVEGLAAEAHSLGFDLVAIVPTDSPTTYGQYRAWLEQGYQGGMGYLARPDAIAKRGDLDLILPGARSVLVVGANHFSYPLVLELRDDPSRGIIASYAWGEDYHDLLGPRLHKLAAFVETEMGKPVAHRAYVDTGPILERDLAARAGLGFVGKNTNLIQPGLGSWLFLAELLLTIELPPFTSVWQGPLSHRPGSQTASEQGLVRDLTQHAGDQESGIPELSTRPAGQSFGQGTCGGCTRCLDACPTGALIAPYILDARRCISYLTIESKGPIPLEFRSQIGNRIFGCDICQEVCPWNRRFARPTAEPAFQARPDSIAPALLGLVALDDEGFRRRFRGSPLARAKRRGLLRNVAVALGNWGDPVAVPALERALHDHEPLIRGHAAWALGRIGTPQVCQILEQGLETEPDPWVREELSQVL